MVSEDDLQSHLIQAWITGIRGKMWVLGCFQLFYCFIMCVSGDITRSAAKFHTLFPQTQTEALLALTEMGTGP